MLKPLSIMANISDSFGVSVMRADDQMTQQGEVPQYGLYKFRNMKSFENIDRRQIIIVYYT